MRPTIALLGIMTSLVALAGYASTTKQQLQTGVHLDQSQDIYFEQFTPGTFALELLQSKSNFGKHDLIIGGAIEADLQHWQGNKIFISPAGTYTHGNGIYLTEIVLDAMLNMNDWLTGFFSIEDSHIGNGAPGGNYTYIPHAFMMYGNNDQFPLYLTLGINDVPFGVFLGTQTWDMPLTQDYFQPLQAPQFSIGYNKGKFNAVASGMHDQTNYQYEYVYSVSYNQDEGTLTYRLGAGYLTHLVTNNTGNSSVGSVRRGMSGQSMGAVVDINASIGYRQVSVSAEYDRGQYVVANNRSQPRAYALVASYTPTLAGKETTFSLSHSQSYYLRNIPTSLSGKNQLPQVIAGLKNAWAASVSRPILTKYITLGLDLEKATTYANQNTYTQTLDLEIYI